jgi:putative NADH-flavin reductase
MKATGVRRLLVLGDAILLDTDEGTMLGEQEDFPADRQAYASEHIKMFEQLSTSAVDWTLVCPETVTDEEAARAYVTAINKQPAGYAVEISAGDLARFMVREMTSQEFLQQRVGIATAR